MIDSEPYDLLVRRTGPRVTAQCQHRPDLDGLPRADIDKPERSVAQSTPASATTGSFAAARSSHKGQRRPNDQACRQPMSGQLASHCHLTTLILPSSLRAECRHALGSTPPRSRAVQEMTRGTMDAFLRSCHVNLSCSKVSHRSKF